MSHDPTRDPQPLPPGGLRWLPGSTPGVSSTSHLGTRVLVPDAQLRARIAELEGLLREARPVIDPAADGCRVWRWESLRATTPRPECECVACRIARLDLPPAPPIAPCAACRSLRPDTCRACGYAQSLNVVPPVVEWRDDEAGPQMAGFVREAAEPRNAAWLVTLSTGADLDGRVTTCALISRQDSPLFATPAEARAWAEALLARCPR